LSLVLNHGIALGYVNMNHAQPGEELGVVIRSSTVPAKVVLPPFIKKG
jgi:glycine cleavage system aminomethyltransferase T